jgi:hypothetical protein
MRVMPIGSCDHGFYYQRNIQPAKKLSADEQVELEASWNKIKPTHTMAQFQEWKALNADKFEDLDGLKFGEIMEGINRRFDSGLIYRSRVKNAVYA